MLVYGPDCERVLLRGCARGAFGLDPNPWRIAGDEGRLQRGRNAMARALLLAAKMGMLEERRADKDTGDGACHAKEMIVKASVAAGHENLSQLEHTGEG